MEKSKLSNLAVEIFSVVFAVLFALFVNQCRQKSDNIQLGERSLKNITSEITSNKKLVDSTVIAQGNTIKEIDSLLLILDKEKGGINSPHFKFEILDNTAWETAKTTRAIEYIEMETVTKMTKLYNSTELYNNLISKMIDQLIFGSEFEDIKTFEKTLKKQKVYVLSLKSIGAQLSEDYKTFLKRTGK